MTLSRNEIAAFIIAALALHVAGFYWFFAIRSVPPGAMAPGSGGIMIDLAGQAGDGGAQLGEAIAPEPEPQPVEEMAPPEPEPVIKPVLKPEPKPVPKPKQKPKPQPRAQTERTPPRESKAEPDTRSGSEQAMPGARSGKPGLAISGKAGDGKATGGGAPGARADYRTLIISMLTREKRYPLRARMRGIEGTGLLRLVIAPDGTLVSSEIETSSGSSILDAEIERMVERAAPFPPFPENMTQKQITMRIPVEFEIR